MQQYLFTTAQILNPTVRIRCPCALATIFLSLSWSKVSLTSRDASQQLGCDLCSFLTRVEIWKDWFRWLIFEWRWELSSEISNFRKWQFDKRTRSYSKTYIINNGLFISFQLFPTSAKRKDEDSSENLEHFLLRICLVLPEYFSHHSNHFTFVVILYLC